MTWPSPITSFEAEHWCKYSVIRKTIKHKVDGLVEQDSWVERCRCGRTIRVKSMMAVEMDSMRANPSIKMRKDWFDADGNHERTSGLENANQKVDKPAAEGDNTSV